MSDFYIKIIIFLSVTVLSYNVNNVSYAGACSPGIPCTGYDIYSQTDAGTSADYNGAKGGGYFLSPSNSYSTTACDGNFMNQIYAQAFMEAQREVMMSEQIIHKPDSVLEYTCFDQYVGIATEHLDGIFSAHQGWDEKEIELFSEEDDVNPDEVTINDSDTTYLSDQSDFSVFEDDRLDNLLEDLLFDNLEDYIDDNFSHTFMGESITLDNDMDTSNITTTYDCAHMLAIWEIAKCVDFGEDDRFRSFEHLISNEPRSIPVACRQSDTSNTPATQISSDSVEQGDDNTKLDNTASGDSLNIAGLSIGGSLLTRMPSEGLINNCPDAGGPQTTVNTDLSNDLIRVANNCDATGSGTNTNIYSAFDLMETYKNLTKGFGVSIPGAGTSSGVITCASPIPTGVPVVTFTHDAPNLGSASSGYAQVNRLMFVHYDHICPNPGCYYQPVKVVYAQGADLPEPDTISAGVCLPSF